MKWKISFQQQQNSLNRQKDIVTNIHHQQFGTVVKENIVKTIAAGGEVFIGPFKQAAFNDANHKVQITYQQSGAAVDPADMNVAALYLDQQ